jgi:kinesin family member C1
MLEIYNDEIPDLLSINHVQLKMQILQKYNIKHNGNGNTHVSDLIVVAIMKISEVSSLLRWAAQNRSHTCSI